jgi:hypothetical protein
MQEWPWNTQFYLVSERKGRSSAALLLQGFRYFYYSDRIAIFNGPELFQLIENPGDKIDGKEI